MFFCFNINSDLALVNSVPAMSESNLQTKSELQYWQHPVDLKATNHLLVLNFVTIAEANLQKLEKARDALLINIGLPLKRICSEIKGIKFWPSLHV